MKTLRILLADDHEMLRRGLRAILTEQPGWQICGEAIDGRQAVELRGNLRPDVIVMDIAMPELNGLEATRQIRRVLPRAEILVLTFDESEALVPRGYLRRRARLRAEERCESRARPCGGVSEPASALFYVEGRGGSFDGIWPRAESAGIDVSRWAPAHRTRAGSHAACGRRNEHQRSCSGISTSAPRLLKIIAPTSCAS